MIPIVENASLSTDLDCQFNDLLKILHFYPTPPGLVQLTDPRLSDPRPVLDGSVINESVSGHAAIVQSKLNLNGVMPPAWFAAPGPPPASEIDAPAPPVWAARGDLAELIQRKGVPNGYAAVDSNLRLLPENVTPGAGLGTVSEVLFSFPDQFDVTQEINAPAGLADGSPVSFWMDSSGNGNDATQGVSNAGSPATCTVTWKPVPNNSWFGINGATGMSGFGSAGPGVTQMDPQFYTGHLPMPLIPDIDASKFTTGLFDPEVLPIAEFGENHHPGMVPDPGLQGDRYEYLGRDMLYHHFTSGPPYQPQIQMPSITLVELHNTTATVTIRSPEPDSVLFWRGGRPSFAEAPPSGPDIHITVLVPRGVLVEAYAAKQGYNNSDVASYTVPLPEVPPQVPDDILTEAS